jgi:hypothetical protein
MEMPRVAMQTARQPPGQGCAIASHYYRQEGSDVASRREIAALRFAALALTD